jgi:hypothetical protein
VSFAAINLRVASQRVFIVVSVYFVIDSVRKLLDILSYVARMASIFHHLPQNFVCSKCFKNASLFCCFYMW